jgi:hypothetical protein
MVPISRQYDQPLATVIFQPAERINSKTVVGKFEAIFQGKFIDPKPLANTLPGMIFKTVIEVFAYGKEQVGVFASFLPACFITMYPVEGRLARASSFDQRLFSEPQEGCRRYRRSF